LRLALFVQHLKTFSVFLASAPLGSVPSAGKKLFRFRGRNFTLKVKKSSHSGKGCSLVSLDEKSRYLPRRPPRLIFLVVGLSRDDVLTAVSQAGGHHPGSHYEPLHTPDQRGGM
jgi:hypothetical protein